MTDIEINEIDAAQTEEVDGKKLAIKLALMAGATTAALVVTGFVIKAIEKKS